MIEKEKFERHLRGTNLSENTISSYMFAIKQYGEQYDDITQKKLREYKVWLIENYKPKTVNLRLRAINCYLECIGKEKWKLPFVRVQQKSFLENVISEADYEYFKSCLKRDDETFWYFVIRFLAATGARVSELIQIKAEHVKLGHLDLYSKGGKLRRIYIPKELQNEALSWLAEKQQESGFIFLNKYGERITTRGISGQLKKLAVRYDINPAVVYPHSFRHRFAKNFLERCNDIAEQVSPEQPSVILSFSAVVRSLFFLQINSQYFCNLSQNAVNICIQTCSFFLILLDQFLRRQNFFFLVRISAEINVVCSVR